MTEENFFDQDGISVTDKRVVIGGQTYALSAISSVRFIEEQPSRKVPIILGIVGMAMWGLNSAALTIFGLFLVGGAVAKFIYQKPTYSVGLVTTSGDSRAISSKEKGYISKIVNAINEAIIARG